jgi:hypothetical protein
MHPYDTIKISLPVAHTNNTHKFEHKKPNNINASVQIKSVLVTMPNLPSSDACSIQYESSSVLIIA